MLSFVTAVVRRHLEGLLADMRALRLFRADEVAVGEGVRSRLAHAGGTLEAFRAIDLLTEDEFEAWNGRFIEAATGEARPVVAARHVSEGAATDVAVPIGKSIPPLSTPEFEGGRFQRLIPGTDEEKFFRGGRLRILAVEQYDDGLAVQWLFAPPSEGAISQIDDHEADLDALSPQEREARLIEHQYALRGSLAPHWISLADDVGTSYRGQAGGSIGSLSQIFGRYTFVPTVPDEVTEVHVDADGVVFIVVIP
jgi:hypothetical protein